MARAVSQTINLQASDTSTKYIARIDENGITVHPEVWSNQTNYIQITGDGLKVYKDGKLKGLFGAITSLYANDGSNSSGVYPKTDITSSGITIAYSNLYKTSIDNTGLKIYAGDASIPIAQFGDIVTIGNANKTHITIDSRTLQMFINSSNNSYLYIGSYGDENGHLTVTETHYWYTNEGRIWLGNSLADGTSYTIKLNGTTLTSSQAGISTNTYPAALYIYQGTSVSEGDKIEVTYTSGGINGQAFVFGSRDNYTSAIGTCPGLRSFTTGEGHKAMGAYSICGGRNNTTSGIGNIAVGYYNSAFGDYSIAAGNNTQARSPYSVALGSNTISTTLHGLVCGRYNDATSGVDMFAVGGGSSDTERKNIFRVTTNDVWIRGIVYLGQDELATGTGSSLVCGTTMSWNGTLYSPICKSSSASKYKEEIQLVTKPELDPHQLYNLPVRQFRYKEGVIIQSDEYNKTRPELIGLIAEEVDEYYSPACVKENGEPSNWSERIMIPAMLALIQEQHQQIEELTHRVNELENK